MKKLFVSILVLLALGAAAALTCPDKEAHKKAISEVVKESVKDGLGGDDAEDSLGLIEGIASIGSSLSEAFLESQLTVDNYLVYSVGSIRHGKESDTVSVGVFGHVFTVKKEQIKEKLIGAK